MSGSIRLGLTLPVLLVACGGGETRPTLPDETADYGGAGGGSHSREGTSRVAVADVDGTQWQWIEAHCTEGPLDLAVQGFAQTLHVERSENALVLVYDQSFRARQCVQTVVQSATPSQDPDTWQMVEEVRLALPATDECYGRREEPRPGEVRRAGQFLEVLVQRSQWCNGLEVRMVYAPKERAPLEPDQVVRHYVAHWNRRDAILLGDLFAESGSLVEPFTVSPTGGTTRHDGRQAVRRWHLLSFAGVPWVAVRLDGVEQGREGGQMIATWSYMDPRLSEPFTGRHQFTIAGGEIFEAAIAAAEAPQMQPSAGEAAAQR